MRAILEKFKKPKAGSMPAGQTAMFYAPADVEYTKQDKQSWIWAPAVHQGQYTNTWWGNQLPGFGTTIPGVVSSQMLWYHPRTLMNNPNWAIQYNRGYNIQSQGAVQSAVLQQQIQQAWQNRYT